jgi:hypothetical protein
VQHDVVPQISLFQVLFKPVYSKLMKFNDTVLVHGVLVLKGELHDRHEEAFDGLKAEQFMNGLSFFAEQLLHDVDENVADDCLELLFRLVLDVAPRKVLPAFDDRGEDLHVAAKYATYTYLGS